MTLRPLAALLLLASIGVAQQIDRRSREEPEIAVNAGGRIGFCDALRFSADGKHLFAAGDDKVVTVWPVNTQGTPRLVTDRTDTGMQVLRWPSWRERRGGIKQLSVSPDGTRVAVGGYGLLTSGVAILDRAKSSGDTTELAAYTWPKARPAVDDFGTVTAVAFDPAGKRVAFGTADGSVWVWTPTKLAKPEGGPTDIPRDWASPVRAGRHTPAGGEQGKLLFATRSRLVYFSGDSVVSVSMSGEAVQFDVTDKLTDDPAAAVPAGKKLFHLNEQDSLVGRLYRAERTPDGGGIAVAFMGPRAAVVDLTGKPQQDFTLPAEHFARSISVEPKTGRVAIGVGGPRGKEGVQRFYLERANEIWVYSPKAAEPTKLPGGERIDSVMFSPTRAGLLAAAGGETDEVQLFDLDGKKPEAAASVARGVGRKPYSVALGKNGVLAVKVKANPDATHPNDAGAGDWIAYDLSETRTFGPVSKAKDLSTAVDAADDWKIVADAADREVWWAVRGDEKTKITFDHRRYNEPTCYTFIPKTDTTPTRLLVGHYHGASLFTLPAAGVKQAEARPERVFVAHTTEALSIAASADGSWFVTGGADQTVSAFSLKDWGTTSPAAGVGVKNEDGACVVTDVAVGAPGWEAGLKKGDRIRKLIVGGRAVVYDRTGAEAKGTAKDVADALKAAAPGVELLFTVDAAEGASPLRLTTVQQRPLWKWFAGYAGDRVTDAVVWMWKGSWYTASSPGADELLGWHVNPPEVLGSPRFHPMKAFEGLFQKDTVVDELLRTRDVAAALVVGAKLIGAKQNDAVLKLAGKEPPRVALELSEREVRGKAVTATVRVDARGSDVDLRPERVELWLNDHRLKVWNNPPAQVAAPVDIDPTVLRGGENTLTVLTFNSGGGRGESTPRNLRNPNAVSEPALLGLSVGVNSYADHRKKNAGGVRGVLGDLNYAAADARGVFDRLGEQTGAGRVFGSNKIALKTDADAKRKTLADALDEWAKAKDVKPDDVLVLFLAGHGQRIGEIIRSGKPATEIVPDGGKAGSYTNLRFAFCCPDFDLDDPAAGSISAEALFDKLAAVNCRKLVFLDVCHSGEAAQANALRKMLPHDQAPFVFAACERGQKSFENPTLKHGLFTQAILEATGRDWPADDDRDGKLSCEELVRYCTDRVIELGRDEAKQTDPAAVSGQTPVCYPKPPQLVVAKLPKK